MKTNDIKNRTINVETILCKIRKKIKEEKLSKDMLTFEDNFDDKFLSLIPPNNGFVDIEQQLDILRNSWNIQTDKPLNGSRLVIFIKRIIRKLIRFFLIPIVKEQNAFNWSVIKILEKNCEQKIEIESLQNRIVQLEKLIYTMPISSDQELFFKKGSFANNYLVKGFYAPEDNLTWTSQEIAEINIPISITNAELKLKITGHKFTTLQTVEMNINNHLHKNIENTTSEFIIKMAELIEQKHLNIKIILPKLYSPKELGMSDDTRKLGFALMAISLNLDMNKEVIHNG
jgi:hypothetical protein